MGRRAIRRRQSLSNCGRVPRRAEAANCRHDIAECLALGLLNSPAHYQADQNSVRNRMLMKIDLKRDRKKLFAYAQQRLDDFHVYENDGPGEDDDPVSMITFGYEYSQAGWAVLNFDTRPNANPDGEWTGHIENDLLEFANWTDAIERLYSDDESIELVLDDGTKRILDTESGESEFVESLGELLKGILVELRESGAFGSLPLADRCIMGVEHFSGAYGWPSWDNRETEGAVNRL